MEGNKKTDFLKQFRKYLSHAHAVDIKVEILRPAVEQIIEDYEDAGNMALNSAHNAEDITNAFCDQGYWIALLNLLNKA